MELHFASGRTYDIFGITGEITIGSLVNATSQLSKHVQEHPEKDLALDLSEVEYVDSSGTRFFINLHKRKEEQGREFYLVRPSEAVRDMLDKSRLVEVFAVLESPEELEHQASGDMYERYLPYTLDEDGLKALHCTCAICGSQDTSGYLLDMNTFDWRWQESNPFPTAYLPGEETLIDAFALQPIVCLECFMVSQRPEYFNYVDSNGAIAIKTKLDDRSKMLLSKAIKKRRAMAEQLAEQRNEAIRDGFLPEAFSFDGYFAAPRSKHAAYTAYVLAEYCIRTLAVNKDVAGPFAVGYHNYLALKYAENKYKDELISNCRTWFTQTIATADSLSTLELAISYFVLLVANINLGKAKDAAQIYNSFSELVAALPNSENIGGVSSPGFWYSQAEAFWHEEINSKSRVLKSKDK